MSTAFGPYHSTATQAPASLPPLRPGDDSVEWAPPSVCVDFRLTPSAFRVLIAVASAHGWLVMSQRELAEALQLDPRHTGRTLRLLARAGYIESTRWRGPARRAYRTRRLAVPA